jgi:hypothetical protein
MKKILLFEVSVITILAINFSSIQTSHSEEVTTMRWKQKLCEDGYTSYEICQFLGDGNLCDQWGMRTRNCSPSTN